MSHGANRGLPFPEKQRRRRASSGAEPTREGAGGFVENVKETAQQWGSAAAEQAQEAWDAGRRQVENFSSGMIETAGDAWDSSRKFIRRHPLASILMAFAIGALVAGALSGAALAQDRNR